MSDVQPRGEALRKAVRFVSEKREEEPGRPVSGWVTEAIRRFDLNPAQAEWLHRFLRERESPAGPGDTAGSGGTAGPTGEGS